MSTVPRLSTRVVYSTRSVHPFVQSQSRPLSQTAAALFPRVSSEDKDSINTEATEYTKSGTDDAAAKQDEAAFDPNNTDPQESLKQAGKGNEQSGNPLDVSPANPEVSKQRPTTEGGAEKNTGSGEQSGHGSPSKAQKT